MGFGGVVELEGIRLGRERGDLVGEEGRTFLSQAFHFCPPTRTLTVLSMSPAETTTPWSSLKVLNMVLTAGTGRAAFGGGMLGRGCVWSRSRCWTVGFNFEWDPDGRCVGWQAIGLLGSASRGVWAWMFRAWWSWIGGVAGALEQRFQKFGGFFTKARLGCRGLTRVGPRSTQRFRRPGPGIVDLCRKGERRQSRAMLQRDRQGSC